MLKFTFIYFHTTSLEPNRQSISSFNISFVLTVAVSVKASAVMARRADAGVVAGVCAARADGLGVAAWRHLGGAVLQRFGQVLGPIL